MIFTAPRDDKIAIGIDGDRRVHLFLVGRAVYQELGALCDSCGGVPLSVNTPAIAILVLAAPSHDKVAGRIHCYRREHLLLGRQTVHSEFAALGGAGCVISFGIHSPAITVLVFAGPSDYKFPVGVHGDRRVELLFVRRAIDTEFTTLSHSGRVVSLSIDTPTVAVLILAGPTDDKIAGRIHRNGRVKLFLVSVSVDPEFPALSGTGGVVTLTINAPVVSVLVLTRPDDDKVASITHGNGGSKLVLCRGRVNSEFPPLSDTGGIKSLSVYSPAVAILVFARPRHDVVSVGIHRHTARTTKINREATVNRNVGGNLIVRSSCVDTDFAANGRGCTRGEAKRQYTVGR